MGSFDLHKFTFHHVIIICANAHLVKPFRRKRFEFLLKKCLTDYQKEYIIEILLSSQYKDSTWKFNQKIQVKVTFILV